jgi:hypothetical protein
MVERLHDIITVIAGLFLPFTFECWKLAGSTYINV